MDGWPGLLISVGLGLAGAIGQLLIFYRPPSNKPSSRPEVNAGRTAFGQKGFGCQHERNRGHIAETLITWNASWVVGVHGWDR
jgi:hypothetical protein